MDKTLRNIKSLEDIRVEKARLRYESLLAESRMTESIRAATQVFSLFASLKRMSRGIKTAYNLLSSLSGLIARIFGKKKQEKERTSQAEDDTVRY